MEDVDVAAIPFMPLYVSDYLADTSHLSTVEHGAYLLLIMTYWQRAEALPDDDKKLARIARMTPTEWSEARAEIADLFDIAEGSWRHSRIEQELGRARAKLEAARNAGKASAQRRLNGRSTDAEKAFNHKEGEGEREEPNGSNPNPFAGEAWDGWLEARKKPPTERAVKLAISTLTKLQAEGHAPEDVLNQSTMNGWTGLFPLKGRTNGADVRGGGWNGDKRSGLGRAIDRELGQ
jgi:uncharacterized protein YdaU (DUF1376 family)